MSDEKSIRVSVIKTQQWTNHLFSFQVKRPDGFRFTAGQFVRLGIDNHSLQYYQQKNINIDTVFRAYSIVSSPFDEFLEFFSVVVPDGAFTAKLQYLAVGDEILLNPTPFGFLTLTRYQKPLPQDLWLLATGTGVAPFLSILQTLDVWQQYRQIFLVYSVRTKQELAYIDLIGQLKKRYGEGGAMFQFVPILTRDPNFDGLNQRLPILIREKTLQNFLNYPLSSQSSHVMLCGNPQMVEDTKNVLKNLGLSMNRRGEGNIAVENYW